jgi:hypothetical protein
MYVLIGKQAPPSSQPAAKHESLNAQLAPYAAKIVTMSGIIARKNGVNVVEKAELRSEEAVWHQSGSNHGPKSLFYSFSLRAVCEPDRPSSRLPSARSRVVLQPLPESSLPELSRSMDS